MRPLAPLLFAASLLAALVTPATALATEYRSVEGQGAVLYDAPSQKGKRLYLLKPLTPLELVVRLEGWTKVRDAEGSMAWIENRFLGSKPMLVVIAAKADIRLNDRPDAPISFEAEKWVALELVDRASPGWLKVRHSDGMSGFVRTTQVWGQ